MADYVALEAAVFARMEKAHQVAAGILAGIVLKKGFVNRKKWSPDAEVSYLRAYYQDNGEHRHAGDKTLWRTSLTLSVDLLLVLGTDNAIGNQILAALQTEEVFKTDSLLPFGTVGDGLCFEEGLRKKNPREDGDHWLMGVSIPAYWDEIRPQ